MNVFQTKMLGEPSSPLAHNVARHVLRMLEEDDADAVELVHDSRNISVDLVVRRDHWEFKTRLDETLDLTDAVHRAVGDVRRQMRDQRGALFERQYTREMGYLDETARLLTGRLLTGRFPDYQGFPSEELK